MLQTRSFTSIACLQPEWFDLLFPVLFDDVISGQSFFLVSYVT